MRTGRLLVIAIAVLFYAGGSGGFAQPVAALRVMTANMWIGGTQAGMPLSQTAALIQAAGADVVGLQEVGTSSQPLANLLGFHHYAFNSDVAIISRYPIAEVLPLGVKLQLSPQQVAYMFNIHLAAFPYQPYMVRANPGVQESQLINSAQATRGAALTSALNGMSSAIATGDPVFLTGDFNEPSHLDWTEDAAAAGLHFGRKVNWPASRAVAARGMIDAFRELRPDEILDSAETWTPGAPAPSVAANEVHDRIDFVYYAGLGVSPTEALVTGYDSNDGITDIAVRPYPSDHRGVVVEFALAVPEPALGSLLSGLVVAAVSAARRDRRRNRRESSRADEGGRAMPGSRS